MPNTQLQHLRKQLDEYLARPWIYPDEVRTVNKLARQLGVTLQWKMVRVDLWAGKPVDTGTTT
jgi:hypothetical protein